MRVLIFFAFLVVAFSVSVFDKVRHSKAQHLFQQWKREQNKVYLSEAEESSRFENFKASLKRISQKNQESSQRGGAKFGLNKFSDMSPEDFKRQYLMRNPIKSDGRHPEFTRLPETNIPQAIDWRQQGVVSKVKDQQQCGSCWAFSVTEAIESAWMLAKGIKNTTFAPLAPQQIVDCDDEDQGCNGGNPPTAYAYLMSAGGLDYERSYPYKAVDGQCKFNKATIGAKISNWAYATSEYDEATLKQSVAMAGPLSICVDAANWQDYTSGVMGAWQCAWINELDHCVQVVGYDMTASTKFWNVRNSWGESWGENGYIRLEYGGNACGLTNEATYPKI